jgi:2-polyprenyl-6-methoxyphenol hydroxylase-like FAD-dependent oxidoreductase
MAGVLPIGTPSNTTRRQTAFFWSLRCDRWETWQASGLDAWKADVLSLWPETRPLLDQIATPERLTFARYAHRTLSKPAAAGLIHIGDAWHSASPQLGQGANMALLDAWALGQALREAADVAEALERTVGSRRGHIRLYQAMSAVFTPVYQSDSRALPLLRDVVVGPSSRTWPATWLQAAMVSGLLNDPLTRLGLA